MADAESAIAVHSVPICTGEFRGAQPLLWRYGRSGASDPSVMPNCEPRGFSRIHACDLAIQRAKAARFLSEGWTVSDALQNKRYE